VISDILVDGPHALDINFIHVLLIAPRREYQMNENDRLAGVLLDLLLRLLIGPLISKRAGFVTNEHIIVG